MSHRRAASTAEPSDKRRPAPSTASISSSAVGSSSSANNLQPFEGLSPSEIAFIDAIIRRVPSHVTNFVPVFKAYQDEFEARNQSATDDQFYYNLLLKLGMIRADNWSERWKVVCEYWGYTTSPPQPFLRGEEASEDEDILHEKTVKQRDIVQHVDYDVEDGDAFTLHSEAESIHSAPNPAPQPPPSYHSKKPSKPTEANHTRDNPIIERVASSSTQSRTDIRFGDNRRRRISTISREGTRYALQSAQEPPSPTSAIPPSYQTNPRVRKDSAHVPAQPSALTQVDTGPQTRDDTETWRIIQMERDADLFRREFLLSCCLDVWVKGLRWIEVCYSSHLRQSISHLIYSILSS